MLTTEQLKVLEKVSEVFGTTVSRQKFNQFFKETFEEIATLESELIEINEQISYDLRYLGLTYSADDLSMMIGEQLENYRSIKERLLKLKLKISTGEDLLEFLSVKLI